MHSACMWNLILYACNMKFLNIRMVVKNLQLSPPPPALLAPVAWNPKCFSFRETKLCYSQNSGVYGIIFGNPEPTWGFPVSFQLGYIWVLLSAYKHPYVQKFHSYKILSEEHAEDIIYLRKGYVTHRARALHDRGEIKSENVVVFQQKMVQCLAQLEVGRTATEPI